MPPKMVVIYNHITELDVDRKINEFLPLIASCSKGNIGALNAEIYAERVNLMVKLVLNYGNSQLGGEVTEILVVICMNRDYMCFMRKKYGEYILKK